MEYKGFVPIFVCILSIRSMSHSDEFNILQELARNFL